MVKVSVLPWADKDSTLNGGFLDSFDKQGGIA